MFVNENTAQGANNGANTFQVGVNNIDRGTPNETGILLPWTIDPKFSWIDRADYIGVELDSGIVVHRALPQSIQPIDTLGSDDINDPEFGRMITGVNTISGGTFADVVQRMAHSVYRFNLRGWARRAGYQVPIPTLKVVAGVPAIPDDSVPQRTTGNMIIGNMSGIPMYFCKWDLWYTTAVPPSKRQSPVESLAERISAADKLPTGGIQVPINAPDDYARAAGPVRPLPALQQPIRRGP